MSRKRFSAEEIVNTLRQADVLFSQGQTVAQVCKQIVVTGSDVLPMAQGIRQSEDRPGGGSEGA